MGRPYKCPYCGESDSVSKGVRKTKTMGERRIRLCKACSRKFTPRNQKSGEELAVPDANQPATIAAMLVEKPAESLHQTDVAPDSVQPASEVPAVPAAPDDGKPA